MGAFTTIATMAGGIFAGTGAAIVTEGVVTEIGFRYAPTKLGKFCVSMCAITLGQASFDKVNGMFTEQCIELLEAIDNFRKPEPEKKEIDRDEAIKEAEEKLEVRVGSNKSEDK
jgi:hypothetical protein